MKNAIILHGTDASPDSNWFQWLKEQLKGRDFEVWLPQLPDSSRPDMKKYLDFILNQGIKFDEKTILIGHSSGAVAALGILSKLETPIKAAYLISAFRNSLSWDALDGLFTEEVDYMKAGKNAKKIVFFHSDNDPYCPLEHAEYLSKQTGGQLVIIKGQGHFNTENSPKYAKFPKLLELIEQN